MPEPASRWLIVKQMKATGCVETKWEEEELLEQIIKDSSVYIAERSILCKFPPLTGCLGEGKQRSSVTLQLSHSFFL